MSKGVRTRRKRILLSERGGVPQTASEGVSGTPLPVFIGQTAGYDQLEGYSISTGEFVTNRYYLAPRYGNCTVTHLNVYCCTAAGNARMFLYTDNGLAITGAKPATLVAQTASFTLVHGWNKVAVITPAVIGTGHYWVGYEFNNGGAAFGGRPGTERGVGRLVGSHTFGSFPSTAPSCSWVGDDNMCMYVTLTSNDHSKPADPAAPSAPSPISGAGYSLTFRDEFEWFNREQWTNQVWWDGTAQPDSQYCESSALKLVARETDGYDVTAAHGSGYLYYEDGWPHNLVDTVGMPGLDAFTYGYYEARMRSTGGEADYPAFWLFSTNWAKHSGEYPYSGTSGEKAAWCSANPTYRGAEIDIMELWGENYPTIRSGTIHTDSSNVCSTNINNADPGTTPPGNSFNDTGVTCVGEWRTYGCKWEPNLMSWYIDNTLTHTWNISSSIYDGLETDMHLLFYTWPWTNDLSGQPNPATTPAELFTEIDWVRVWQQ